MNDKVILSLFILGLSFGFGPCLASCGPLLISYITGAGKNIRRAVIAYLLFSLARILVYIILSLLFFYFSRFLLEGFFAKISGFIYVGGGIFIIFCGIMIAFGKKLEFPHFKTNIFILGLIVGVLPCGPLLSVLAYIGLVSKTWMQSLTYGLSFSLGTFISPLLALSVAAGAFGQFILAKKQQYSRILTFICAAIIIFLGIQLIMRGIISNA